MKNGMFFMKRLIKIETSFKKQSLYNFCLRIRNATSSNFTEFLITHTECIIAQIALQQKRGNFPFAN